MMPSYTVTRQIAFHETDAAGVAHFSRLLSVVEVAQHESLRACGVAVFTEDCGWPRVHLTVDYASPVRCGDVLEITVCPAQLGRSSIEWRFNATCEGRPVMNGQYTVVRVGKGGKARAISAEERECLISGFSKD